MELKKGKALLFGQKAWVRFVTETKALVVDFIRLQSQDINIISSVKTGGSFAIPAQYSLLAFK